MRAELLFAVKWMDVEMAFSAGAVVPEAPNGFLRALRANEAETHARTHARTHRHTPASVTPSEELMSLSFLSRASSSTRMRGGEKKEESDYANGNSLISRTERNC